MKPLTFESDLRLTPFPAPWHPETHTLPDQRVGDGRREIPPGQ